MNLKEYSREEVLEIVIASIPLPKHMEQIKISERQEGISFIWWQSHYIVSTQLKVSIIDGIMIGGGPKAMLMEALIKEIAYKRELAKSLGLSL
ncbi:MAG TPA: hypothetical protein VI815_02855 [Candidatus Nanoarchaeia archaeon]|nr:hypothetical protein [Candidatus Nanoarchaeia archaeon]